MLAIDATFSIVPDLVLVSITKPSDSFDNSSSNGSGIVVEEHEQRQQVPKRNYEPETLTIKSAQNFDTAKLVRVTKAMNSLHRGDLNLDSCLASLHEIIEAPATCGPLELCVSFAASGFSATLCMFEGSLFDALLAAALGLMVALLFLISMSFPVYGPVFEISACIMVGIFDRVLHDYVCFSKVAVSSILILLPGYGMTMAVVNYIYLFITFFLPLLITTTIAVSATSFDRKEKKIEIYNKIIIFFRWKYLHIKSLQVLFDLSMQLSTPLC